MLKRILRNSTLNYLPKTASATAGLARRKFLKRTALACGAVALPQIVPSSALGLDGATPPSERLVMGGIGIGGRGGYDLPIFLEFPQVQFVAVCEVQKDRRDAAKRKVDNRYGNTSCAAYRDLRDLLVERTDLDAVLIATGDRWHTPASILAMEAGKDVFCEKPCTMTVAQGQALVETARRQGRIFQAGMQRLSEANFVFCDELARSGRLGQLQTVRAHILPWKMSTERLPAQPEPDRDTLDWDLWLGPAPWRPYNAGYLGGCGAWLDYYDFGTGVAGWGSHTICQCQSALGLKQTSAVEYEYSNNTNAEGYVAHYANGVKLVLSATGWRGSCGVRYEGTEGWASVADGYQKPDVSVARSARGFRQADPRLPGPDPATDAPYPRLPRFGPSPAPVHRQRGCGPPDHDHQSCHQPDHAAQTQSQVGPGQRTVRERCGGESHVVPRPSRPLALVSNAAKPRKPYAI